MFDIQIKIVMKNLEIACFDHISAKIASKSLADRIELCNDLEAGGTTPDLDFFIELKKSTHIPLFIMIRPRGGNFIYSEEEISAMNHSILEFSKHGADGFVFGLLKENGEIDTENCKKLIDSAKGIPCSFHRAIDHTLDYFKAIEEVIDLGFTTILTSGNTNSAENGLDILKEAQDKYGDKISIMPGGGVRSSNLENIVTKSNCNWFHSSAIKNGTQISIEEIENLKSVLSKF